MPSTVSPKLSKVPDPGKLQTLDPIPAKPYPPSFPPPPEKGKPKETPALYNAGMAALGDLGLGFKA